MVIQHYVQQKERLMGGRIATAAVLAVVLMAACGDDDGGIAGDQPAATEPPATTAPTTQPTTGRPATEPAATELAVPAPEGHTQAQTDAAVTAMDNLWTRARTDLGVDLAELNPEAAGLLVEMSAGLCADLDAQTMTAESVASALEALYLGQITYNEDGGLEMPEIYAEAQVSAVALGAGLGLCPHHGDLLEAANALWVETL